MTERLTYLDDHGVPIGVTDRDTVHRDGLWHEVFHCLVVRAAPPARVVLQRRRAGARGFPSLLDISATGHLQTGETPLEGVRELREELGIDADPAALVALGHRRLVDDAGEGLNREIVHAFLLADDRPLETFPVDHDEIGGVVEIETANLLQVLSDREVVAPATEWDGETLRPVVVGAADLVPDVDGYWRALAIVAARFVAGERTLAV